MVADVLAFAREEIGERIAQTPPTGTIRQSALAGGVPSTEVSIFRLPKLAAARARLNQRARDGDRDAGAELGVVKDRQRRLTTSRNRHLAELQAEPERVQVGEVEMLVHALVVPVQDTEELERYECRCRGYRRAGCHRIRSELRRRGNGCLEARTRPTRRVWRIGPASISSRAIPRTPTASPRSAPLRSRGAPGFRGCSDVRKRMGARLQPAGTITGSTLSTTAPRRDRASCACVDPVRQTPRPQPRSICPHHHRGQH